MRKNAGITLIALVVTIIVLLILAGITISLLIGENGIIARANQAKEKYADAALQERIELGDLSTFKIVRVSNAIKGTDVSKLPTKEKYIGDFIKIKTEDLKALGLEFEGEYYANPLTGEVYDIIGDSYQKITYHSIEELKQILYCSSEIDVKRLLKMKYKQLDYLKNNQQHSNGAIATYTRKNEDSYYKIIPYFAASACEDMLIDVGSFEAVKKYIIWHFNHINTTADIFGVVGTIYDYRYEGDVEEASNKYDSIDSYCSLFFTLLEKYLERTGDIQLLLENKDKIVLVEQALNTMYREDRKLTQTKADYNISYLMDNAESYMGYQSLGVLYRKIFQEEEKANQYEERANQIKSGMEENLWNTKKSTVQEFGLYDYAYHNSSYNRILFDKIYYPDILAQIYPILCGIISPNSERAEQIYFLHSYYSEPKWFKYEGEYPHMENLEAVLMCDKQTIQVKSIKVNMEYEIKMAISKILSWEAKHIGDYLWNCQEAGNTINAINMYLNKNSKRDF